MALTGNILVPYPPTLTDASWKAAKTAGIRDKWNTELGAALRAAQLEYNKIKFEQLDIQRLEASKGKLVTIPDVQTAKTGAQLHYKVIVKPAIKALETAKSKAGVASLNPVITPGARTKAGQMSTELGRLLTVLKSFSTHDYDTRLADLQRKYQVTHATFAANMKVVLSAGRKFIVDAHYGEINVRSKQGEGTTFTFTIPKSLEQNERGDVFRLRPDQIKAA